MLKEKELLEALEETSELGYWICPNYENTMEPDAHCSCGTKNPIMEAGMI